MKTKSTEPEETAPDWLEEILVGLSITEGVDTVSWHRDDGDDYVVEIEYGEEEFSFVAGTDGELHGVDFEGQIFDMTTPAEVQWWCAGELYTKLQAAKRRIEELEAKENSN